jgi:hypothetical protein
MDQFEAACAIRVVARAGGTTITSIDPRIAASGKAQWKEVTRHAGGALAWPALLRKLDRIDPSYRS